jgi:hypothetical protein
MEYHIDYSIGANDRSLSGKMVSLGSIRRTLTNAPRGLTYFQRSALGPATIASGSLDRNRRVISRSDDGENPQPHDNGCGFFRLC